MIEDAIHDTRLTYGERIAYFVLARRLDTSEEMPTIFEIAKLLNCTVQQTSRFLTGLQKKGFIIRKRRTGLPTLTTIIDPSAVPVNQVTT